jgi:hypothetical protein
MVIHNVCHVKFMGPSKIHRPGRDTGREPASTAGGRENSLALQTLNVTRLCPQALNVERLLWYSVSLLRCGKDSVLWFSYGDAGEGSAVTGSCQL